MQIYIYLNVWCLSNECQAWYLSVQSLRWCLVSWSTTWETSRVCSPTNNYYQDNLASIFGWVCTDFFLKKSFYYDISSQYQETWPVSDSPGSVGSVGPVGSSVILKNSDQQHVHSGAWAHMFIFVRTLVAQGNTQILDVALSDDCAASIGA